MRCSYLEQTCLTRGNMWVSGARRTPKLARRGQHQSKHVIQARPPHDAGMQQLELCSI